MKKILQLSGMVFIMSGMTNKVFRKRAGGNTVSLLVRRYQNTTAVAVAQQSVCGGCIAGTAIDVTLKVFCAAWGPFCIPDLGRY